MSAVMSPMPRAAASPADAYAPPAADGGHVLLLSTSLLIDRMLLHTGFLRRLGEGTPTEVWASSMANPSYREQWRAQPARVAELPEVGAFRESWHNWPRRVVEDLWDRRRPEPSRVSQRRYRPIKADIPTALRRVLVQGLSPFPVENVLERAVHRWLASYVRSPDAAARLEAARPAVVVTTGPFQFEQPGIVAEAKRRGIPTLALIPSWDNLSTKTRLLYRYDGYMVWSERQRQELHERYPFTRDLPVYVTGAPQFDVFFDPRFRQTREAFCTRHGLRPDLPIVVYAVGSPNFLAGEPHGALACAQAVARGELGDVQLVVRPHPIHDNAEMERLFGDLGPRVHLQRTATPGTRLTARSQDETQITDWVNTFRHAAVVVNLSSTVTVDAAICDVPVVNLNYDPGPGGRDTALVRDINSIWTHFAPVAQSGGVALVDDQAQMLDAVRRYLADPALHRTERRWIVRHVCQYDDGRCGVRMADAILDFADRVRSRGRA